MARKKIREVDAKNLVRKFLKKYSNFNFILPCTQVNQESQDVARMSVHEEQHKWMAESPLVVKPDILIGQRGKHGLVLLKANPESAQAWIDERLNQPLTINGVTGVQNSFIIEPFCPHNEEYYLSFLAESDKIVINFSTEGGVEVEENWDKITTIEVPVGAKIVCDTLLTAQEEAQSSKDVAETLLDEQDVDITADLEKAGVPENLIGTVKEVIASCFRVFEELDFVQLEMNPFVFTEQGEPVALDMVTEVDDTAAFLQTKNWDNLEFPQPFGLAESDEEAYISSLDEKTGASLKLTVLNPEGHVWCLVAGGGASVVFADTVGDLGYGHELGNYGEYSGAPNEEETYNYARTVLDLVTRHNDGKNKALLIGGGIANFTDVAKTFKGIVHAIKEAKEDLLANNVKVFVRRAGPNYLQGMKIMKDVCEEIGIDAIIHNKDVPMTSIIPEAIKWVEASAGGFQKANL